MVCRSWWKKKTQKLGSWGMAQPSLHYQKKMRSRFLRSKALAGANFRDKHLCQILPQWSGAMSSTPNMNQRRLGTNMDYTVVIGASFHHVR